MRKEMDFLVPDSGQRGDDLVETVEPGPSLDVVKRSVPRPSKKVSAAARNLRLRKALIASSFRRSGAAGDGAILFPVRQVSIAPASVEWHDAVAGCAAGSPVVTMLHYHANSDSAAYAH
jgi:hypothetical protein